jgi:hypothetical protein
MSIKEKALQTDLLKERNKKERRHVSAFSEEKKDICVYHTPKGWELRNGNSNKVRYRFGTKIEAVSKAQSIARKENRKLKIFRSNGNFQTRLSMHPVKFLGD